MFWDSLRVSLGVKLVLPDIMVIFDENYFRKIVTSDLSEYEEMIRLREKQEEFLQEQVRGEVTGHKFSKK